MSQNSFITIVCNAKILGHISVQEHNAQRISGQFSPGADYAEFAAYFDAMAYWSEQFDESREDDYAGAIDPYWAWDKWSEAGAQLTELGMTIPELDIAIRHAENGGLDNRARSEKIRGREADLDTQLMDMQENYNALSNRHAKLIAELSRARDGDSDTPLLKEAVGANATERIKRSNSFAEAVEQMVLEYEKTIQTLESSLSKTRSSLSNSESTLLEKETRIAYMETIQAQLQARIQKAMDREQSNESYLHDLEVRMEGTASGEERNAGMINELRKELTRVRESENSAEDYISTLEERLAEAEQDQEIMQREIDRLEHVVERQRSIGRLDNLLGELDGIRRNEDQVPAPNRHSVTSEEPKINGYRDSHDLFRPESRAISSPTGTRDEDFEDAETEQPQLRYGAEDAYGQSAVQNAVQSSAAVAAGHKATQSDFMADKLENLTQELFDLRSEHETVMTDYDKLQQKYQTALETLAKLEYDKEDKDTKTGGKPTSGRVSSFLADAGMRGEEKADTQGPPSSSRSFSAVLPSQQHANSSLEDLMKDVVQHDLGNAATLEDEVKAADVPLPAEDEEGRPELEMLKRLHAEKEENVAELTRTYQSLNAQHEATLGQVEELKQELARARDFRPSSPSFTKPYFSRRKSEDLMSSNSDKASRSITSLKSIADDNFEHNPDTRQSFQINLNTVMTELHNRSDRVQALEAELATTKKEMENKQTIIAGLTRERGSLKASLGVDFSVVQQMREQLLESENQIRALHEQHGERERELHTQIDSLKSSLASHANPLPTPSEDKFSRMPGGFETPARELDEDQATAGASMKTEQQARDIQRLQSELAAWESKHQDAIESMNASESDSSRPLQHWKAHFGRRAMVNPRVLCLMTLSPLHQLLLLAWNENARNTSVSWKHSNVRTRTTSQQPQSHVTKLQQLEQAYAAISQQVDEDSRTRDLSSNELEKHRNLVANLENQLQVHKSAVTIHQESLESLQASHSKELEDLKSSMGAAEKDSTDRYSTLEKQHKSVTDSLQRELNTAQNEKTNLLRSASSALGYETDATKLHSQIKGLVEEGKEIHNRHLKTTNELKAVQEELQNALNNTVELENKIGELKMINEETIRSLEKMTEKEKKSSRLVDELEEQLNSNYDSHRAATNRLSTMQGEVAHQRIQLEQELESQKMKNHMLEVCILSIPSNTIADTNSMQQQVEAFKRQSTVSESAGNFNRESLSPEAAAIALARSGSSSSQARKSTGPTALPTPPPSIPLPPLPGSPSTSTPPIPNGLDSRATSPPLQRATSPNHNSPPGSRHTSNDVGPRMSQQIEEQEARIRTIEKHLFAEKQLTATLEEALVDLETSANRTKAEMEQWRKKCTSLEDELTSFHKERSSSRASLQAVEEEREMRVRAERARQALEQRMMELNSSKKRRRAA